MSFNILCAIPGFDSRETIAMRLGLSSERVAEILESLLSLGLIAREKGQLKTTSKRVFLDKNSPFNHRHHANFRQLVANELDRLDATDFHYSGVHSLSRKDSIAVIELIRELILKSRELILESHEEELFGFNVDFYRV